jgi:hypothetical protein
MEQRYHPLPKWKTDPRVAATWAGASIVLACGLWLYSRGGAPPIPRGVNPTTVSVELMQELVWIDQRLAREDAAGSQDDPQGLCRIASLHWDRAARLSQHEYYRQYGTSWMEEREQEYAGFRARQLGRDSSGDIAATLRAARRSLVIGSPGPARVRALWFLAMAHGVTGRREEQIGALIELTRYKLEQPWVWRLLAQAYQARSDAARQELAEEQAWRADSGRPLSHYITRVIRQTPYARPAPTPDPTSRVAYP